MNQMSKKVYISMAKSGMSLEEIHEKQKSLTETIERVLGETIEILYPAHEANPEDKPLSLLLDNLRLINDADYVVFTEDWNEDHESRLEHEIVIMYGVPYAEVSDEASTRLTIKIYVSTRRDGKSEAELEAEYHEVSRKVYRKLSGTVSLGGIRVVNEPLSYGLNPLEELHERLKQMNEADYVIFMEGSENERAGYIEKKCAEEYGMLYLNEAEINEEEENEGSND